MAGEGESKGSAGDEEWYERLSGAAGGSCREGSTMKSWKKLAKADSSSSIMLLSWYGAGSESGGW